ncbi:MAG: hypothetical protein JNJ83_09035 [Verrucomicrobiaceae bacterium]|nr:hypothetical protein [Verrucomicrobiaceae bacterium]
MKTILLSLLVITTCVLHADAASKSKTSKSKKSSKTTVEKKEPEIPAKKTLSAEMSVNPREFGPGATLEVRFPTPIIPESAVGSFAQQSPIIVVPPLAGKFEWTSTRSGIYRLEEAPKFHSSYRFELREGVVDTEGTSYRAEKLKDVNTERFRIVEQYPKWYSKDNISRTPSFLLEFNDNVQPDVVKGSMAFKCEENKARIQANVRLATGADFKRYYTDPQKTWEEQVAKKPVALAPDAIRASAIIVQPAEPLPPGKDWILDIATTITNASGSSTLAAGDAIKVGTVVPFTLRYVESHSPFDEPRYLTIGFSRSLLGTDQDKAARLLELSSLIKIAPQPANLKYEMSGSAVTLNGDFSLEQKYELSIGSSLQSGDGLGLPGGSKEVAQFQANPPYVAAPAYINAQLSTGKGDFELAAANVSAVTIRARAFSGVELLRAVDMYQAYLNADNGETDPKKRYEPTPLDDYPGTTIYEKTLTFNKPLDTSSVFNLNWREVLGTRPTAPLLLEVEGTAMKGAPGGTTAIAQCLVQFTDIGLFVKDNFKSTTVFAVSLSTGQPLADVRLTLVDSQHKLLGYGQTDASGAVTISGGEAAYVMAEKGQDATAMPAGEDAYDTRMSLWSFDFNTTWTSPWVKNHKCFLFSDRPIYKPGDTAHFKGLVRVTSGDELRLPGKAVTAQMALRDPDYRVIAEREITFSANGTWTSSEALPALGATGWYHLNIKFPNKRDTDDESEDASLAILVDEYRPNTFEVKLDGSKAKIDPERIKVPLSASYLMGKPLSKAAVHWSAMRTIGFTPPSKWSRFHFGDAPRWAHYAEDRDPEQSTSTDDDEPIWDAAGELTINDDGTAEVELPTPPAHSAGLPQTVDIEAEVVDVNQQTIVATSSVHVPGAPVLVGVKGPEYYASAGQVTRIAAIALSPNGKSHTAEVAATIRIERQTYNTVRTETAGGGTTVKHQVILTPELEQPITLKPGANGGPAEAAVDFTPKFGGTYFVTVSLPGENPVIARDFFYSLGGGEYPWAVNDGARIELMADKAEFEAGETANILVKSAISGDAIITVERNSVHQHFRAHIAPESPMIKVPVTDADAPNIYVSVTLVRGANNSPQAVKMPEFRYGYCELKVRSQANVLKVALAPEKSPVLPGEQVNVTGTITDNSGKPVTGADVTVWAVDDGVLSLVDYKLPDPHEFFHSPAPLAIRSYSSFDTLLTEDAEKRYRGNKGFVIGGGDDPSLSGNLSELAARKNFVATALWSASLTTDAAGKVNASFRAPDNLSRFRLMAIVASEATRFGSAESAVVINKPLMLEPAMPRFARLDDEFIAKGILHNTTLHSGTVQVTLKLDDHAEFITQPKPFILTALATEKDKPNGKAWTRNVALKANETTSVEFPVRMSKLGALKWTWTAATSQWSDAKALADKVESTMQIEHPAPENREIVYLRLDGKALPENLIKSVSPVVLEGEGTLNITASMSQIYDVRDALDYVLQYPYGCVEQTSSSTLPWLALAPYAELFQDQIKPGKSKEAIQRGVDRLLQMVTDRGGLGYWPGAEEPSLWGSAYGGFVLLKARDAGANVPKEVIEELTDYLSKELRHLEDERSPYILTDACMAAYTLARAGKAEPAYHTLLFSHRQMLPTRGKLFLALAMLVAKEDENRVRALVGLPLLPVNGKPGTVPGNSGLTSRYTFNDWFGDQINTALRLIICTHLGIKEEAQAAVDKILASRNAHGEWGNTFVNAWTLQAMAAYERSIATKPEPLSIDLAWGENQLKLDLAKPSTVAKGGFILSQALSSQALKATIPPERNAILRVEARSWSKLKEFGGANNGYGLTRSYHKLNPDGTLGTIEDLKVGDQVLVRLDIQTPGEDRYLAINDPLPGVLEAINPEFKTQNGDVNPVGDGEEWFCDHRELRTDRALFFTDFSPGKGNFTLAYQARVIAEGEMIAPSAHIEAMYQPSRNGLSATQRLRTLPNPKGKQVAGKN